MTNDQFITWFQGFLAACGDKGLTVEQLELIKEEMGKITPTITYIPYSPIIYPTWPPDYPYYPWKWSSTSGNTTDLNVCAPDSSSQLILDTP